MTRTPRRRCHTRSGCRQPGTAPWAIRSSQSGTRLRCTGTDPLRSVDPRSRRCRQGRSCTRRSDSGRRAGPSSPGKRPSPRAHTPCCSAWKRGGTCFQSSTRRRRTSRCTRRRRPGTPVPRRRALRCRSRKPRRRSDRRWSRSSCSSRRRRHTQRCQGSCTRLPHSSPRGSSCHRTRTCRSHCSAGPRHTGRWGRTRTFRSTGTSCCAGGRTRGRRPRRRCTR